MSTSIRLKQQVSQQRESIRESIREQRLVRSVSPVYTTVSINVDYDNKETSHPSGC